RHGAHRIDRRLSRRPCAPRGAADRGMKVRFRDVSMRFGDVEVLEAINLDVAEGEFVCILGPSGCGKSTLLNIAGGFLEPAAGEVTIDGERVAGPDRRRIFVFQERGVFPWLSVEGITGFG